MSRREQTIVVPQSQFDEALLTSTVIVLVVALACAIAFYLLRLVLHRWYTTHPRSPAEANRYYSFLPDTLWRYSDESVLKTHGLDYLMYFWVMRFCLAMVCAMALFSLFFVMPLNVAGSRSKTPAFNVTKYYQNGTNTELSQVNLSSSCLQIDIQNITYFPTTGTAIQTMANINATASPDKYFLIAHTFHIMFNTICFMVFSYWLYDRYLQLRIRFRLRKKPENFTVRLSGYPKKVFDSPGKITDMMERIFGSGTVQCTHIVPIGPGVEKMRDLKNKRFALVKKKEECMVAYSDIMHKDGKKDIKAKEELMLELNIASNKIRKCDDEIEALFKTENWVYSAKDKMKMKASTIMPINFMQAKKKERRKPRRLVADWDTLKVPIAPAHEHRRIEENLPKKFSSDVAFVTFKSLMTARVASSAHIGNTVAWEVQPAPSPADVRWSQHVERKNPLVDFLLSFAGVIIAAALCVLWIVPVAFASSLSNLATINKYIPALGVVTNAIVAIPVVSGIVTGFLPQIIIILFFILLVPILQLIERTFFKAKSHSGADGLVIHMYFAFRIVNVLFGGILANSFDQIASQLQQLTESPLAIFPILGQAIPLQTNFFTQYCLVNGLMTAGINLLDPVGVIIHLFFWKILATTPRDYAELYRPELVNWIKIIPVHTFMFLIVAVFSTISPLMLAVGLTYFGGHYLVDRYILLYRKVPKYESGGLFWPIAFQHMCIGMLFYILVMFAVFIDLVWVFGIVVTVIAFIVVMLFWAYMESTFRPLAYHGALYPRALAEDKVLRCADTYLWSYQHPALHPVKEEEYESCPLGDDADLTAVRVVQYDPSATLARNFSDGDDETAMIAPSLNELFVRSPSDEHHDMSAVEMSPRSHMNQS